MPDTKLPRSILMIISLSACLVILGCPPPQEVITSGRAQCIMPAEVVIQNSFSRIVRPQSTAAKARPRLQIFVQVRDVFGDPMKALGIYRFELYQYKPGINDNIRDTQRYETDGILTFDLSAIDRNQKHWEKSTSSYRFDFDCPADMTTVPAVLVQFTLDNGAVRLSHVRSVGQ